MMTLFELPNDPKPPPLIDLVDAALWHFGKRGATDWELTAALRLPDRRKGSVTKRRQELGAVPVIVDGEVVKRLSPDGQWCTVWIHSVLAAHPAGAA